MEFKLILYNFDQIYLYHIKMDYMLNTDFYDYTENVKNGIMLGIFFCIFCILGKIVDRYLLLFLLQ